jgi:hypothetical protein
MKWSNHVIIENVLPLFTSENTPAAIERVNRAVPASKRAAVDLLGKIFVE